MPLRLRSAGGGSVLLKPPVALAADVSMEVPGYDGAKLLTDKTPGAVLQVVNAVMPNARVNTSSTSYVDTGLSATITPTSITSKILVVVQHTGLARSTSGGYIAMILLRGATSILQLETQAAYASDDSTTERSIGGTGSNYLDSPATLSPVTYKTQFKTAAGTGIVFIEGQASITLMEIAA